MLKCLAIVAHEKAKETLEDFWPAWKWLGVPIVAFLPDGETWPIEGTPDHLFHYGKSAHRGSAAFLRLAHCFKTLATLNYDAFTIIEPDCLPMVPRLPPVHAGKFSGWNIQIKECAAWSLCTLPPWTADIQTLRQLSTYLDVSLTAYDEHPDCEGLADRWLMKTVLAADIPMGVLHETLGYVWVDNILQIIRELRPIWVHGFKRKSELQDLWPI